MTTTVLGGTLRRLIPFVLAAGLISGACGDALRGVGDMSEQFVHGDTSSTTSTTSAGPVIDVVRVTDVVWVNEALDAGVSLESDVDVLVSRIWDRSPKTSEFVQASPLEVTTALPGIQFPRLIPGRVTHVSSQLVFDRASLTLDPSQSAAFGLWTVEPYSIPRGEGQLAVLRVGRNQVPGTAEREFSSFIVADGREVAWIDGAYVYSLFCRTGVSEEACFTVAESTAALSILTGGAL